MASQPIFARILWTTALMLLSAQDAQSQVAVNPQDQKRQSQIQQCFEDPLLSDATKILDRAQSSAIKDKVPGESERVDKLNRVLSAFDQIFENHQFQNKSEFSQEVRNFFAEHLSSPPYLGRLFRADLMEVNSKEELRSRLKNSYTAYQLARDELSAALGSLLEHSKRNPPIIKRSDFEDPKVMEAVNVILARSDLSRLSGDKYTAIQDIFEQQRLLSIQYAFTVQLMNNPKITWQELSKLGLFDELTERQKQSIASDYEAYLIRSSQETVVRLGAQIPLVEEEALEASSYRESKNHTEEEIQKYYLEPNKESRRALDDYLSHLKARLSAFYSENLIESASEDDLEILIERRKAEALQSRVHELFARNENSLLNQNKLDRQKAKELGILKFYEDQILIIAEGQSREDAAYEIANQNFEAIRKIRASAKEDAERKETIKKFVEDNSMLPFAQLKSEAEKLGHLKFIDAEAFKVLALTARTRKLIELWSQDYLANPLSQNPLYALPPAEPNSNSLSMISALNATEPVDLQRVLYDGPKSQVELWKSLNEKYSSELSRLNSEFGSLVDTSKIEEQVRLATNRSLGVREFQNLLNEILNPPKMVSLSSDPFPIMEWKVLRAVLEKRDLLDSKGVAEEHYKKAYAQVVFQALEQQRGAALSTSAFLRGYYQSVTHADMENPLGKFQAAQKNLKFNFEQLKKFQKEFPEVFSEAAIEEMDQRLNAVDREYLEKGAKARAEALTQAQADAAAEEESSRWYQRWGSALHRSVMSAGESLHFVVGGSLGTIASAIVHQDARWGGEYINWVNRFGNENHGFSVFGTPEEFAARDSDFTDILIRANPLIHATSIPFAVAKPLLEPIEPALSAVLSLPQRAYDNYTGWAFGINDLEGKEWKAALDKLRRQKLTWGTDGNWTNVSQEDLAKVGNYAFQTSELIGSILLTRGMGGSKIAAEKGAAILARAGVRNASYQQALALGQALQGIKTVASVGGMSFASVLGSEIYYADKQGRPIDYERVFADTLEASSQSAFFSVSMSAIQRAAVLKQFKSLKLPDFDKLPSADKARFISALEKGGRFSQRVDFIEGMSGFQDTFEMLGKADSLTQVFGAALVTGSNVYDTFDISVFQKINGLRAKDLLPKAALQSSESKLR